LHKFTKDIFNTEHGILPGDRLAFSIPVEIATNLLINQKYSLNFNTYVHWQACNANS